MGYERIVLLCFGEVMLDVCAVLFTFLNQGFRGEFFFCKS